ncbi:class I SAM-dependent methyltransferase [Tumebacillus permanentifrigoris]|uniref:Ubiquinone/menaquinone biosynthesis C-methylase UbiE n=1 Tax=Tumebacillus permanentifrigoris TaxID=378543 RepID=A0A316D639_9BACL|nr:class I SAM-dependent methyltransferase [Tumebacillus permanentifrigoris]PWK07894.1 ubiquinone/menaquinone biosynthesis C-methylase UbiE [Tumebacillus permanentifrigoris]
MSKLILHSGPTFYDDPDISKAYWERRKRGLGANTLLEYPIFTELVGSVQGLRVLDLGCGSAQYGVELLNQGCEAYVGLDASVNCYEMARETLAGTSGEARFGTIEEIDLQTEKFDLVVSRLALHYIEDLEAIFQKIYQCLTSGGRFIFSVEHPVITSCNDSYVEGQIRGRWIVDQYFVTGRREYDWLNGKVVKYHRKVEDFFLLLRNSRFRVDFLREATPNREHFATEEEYARWVKVPIFMFFSATKS